MGGYGSGRRFSNRRTIEDCFSISTREFREWGWFARGSGFAWMIAGTRHSCMELREDAGGRILEVNRGSFGRLFGSDREQSISLVSVPLPFGGARWYFVCPCGKRVVNLYRPDAWEEFACRNCHGLLYASQRDQLKALVHRARVIRTNLGGPTKAGPPLPDKPKGMHGRTYVRECYRIVQLELAAGDLFDAFRGQFREGMERVMELMTQPGQE